MRGTYDVCTVPNMSTEREIGTISNRTGICANQKKRASGCRKTTKGGKSRRHNEHDIRMAKLWEATEGRAQRVQNKLESEQGEQQDEARLRNRTGWTSGLC